MTVFFGCCSEGCMPLNALRAVVSSGGVSRDDRRTGVLGVMMPLSAARGFSQHAPVLEHSYTRPTCGQLHSGLGTHVHGSKVSWSFCAFGSLIMGDKINVGLVMRPTRL